MESLEPMAPDSAYATVGVMSNVVIDASRYYLARISYHVDTTALEATQFLNVVFGNSSLQPHIWVVDIEPVSYTHLFWYMSYQCTWRIFY